MANAPISTPGQWDWHRHHPPKPPMPTPPPVNPPPPVPPPVTGLPAPPAGWKETYSRNFVTQNAGDWVTQGGNNAPVKLSQAKGAEFGLGIELTAESQWTEIISSDAVVGPSSFVQALIYIPLASNGEVANWPAWWTTGANWPQDGEIDILEGQSGKAALQTHYGTLEGGGASENSNSLYGPLHTGGWLTVTLLRENGEAKAWYNELLVGSVPAPFTENHKLIFQNQSYSTSVCPNCFGPLVTGVTCWLSKVGVWAPA
jgi:hypothetical protein